LLPPWAASRAAPLCCPNHEQFCPLFHHFAGDFSSKNEHLKNTSKSYCFGGIRLLLFDSIRVLTTTYSGQALWEWGRQPSTWVKKNL
jgi:hypothetical protein